VTTQDDVSVVLDGHVAQVEIRRPPHNYFDVELVRGLADAFEALDREPSCRALVLAAEGRSFCAGASFGAAADVGRGEELLVAGENPLYAEAARLFACAKPVVAAVHGAAIGGGLGLALVADFRVVSRDTRLAANFVQLGIHPGFGLTHTLPRLIGQQKAALLLLTGRRIGGEEAVEWGLADLLVDPARVREAAAELAAEIAAAAPLAVQSTRATLRRGLVEAIRAQTAHEGAEQARLARTEDHREGVAAVRERRPGRFLGR
jgi:enoyl-CoA hydratase/carnithine racemase